MANPSSVVLVVEGREMVVPRALLENAFPFFSRFFSASPLCDRVVLRHAAFDAVNAVIHRVGRDAPLPFDSLCARAGWRRLLSLVEVCGHFGVDGAPLSDAAVALAKRVDGRCAMRVAQSCARYWPNCTPPELSELLRATQRAEKEESAEREVLERENEALRRARAALAEQRRRLAKANETAAANETFVRKWEANGRAVRAADAVIDALCFWSPNTRYEEAVTALRQVVERGAPTLAAMEEATQRQERRAESLRQRVADSTAAVESLEAELRRPLPA